MNYRKLVSEDSECGNAPPVERHLAPGHIPDHIRTRHAIVLAVLVTAAGCSPHEPIAGTSQPRRTPQLASPLPCQSSEVQVSGEVFTEDGELVVNGMPLAPGATIGIISERGWRARARVVGTHECDDCAAPPLRARSPIIEDLPNGTVAIGPVCQEYPQATVVHQNRSARVDPEWQVAVSVDVDGDERVELERVVRCAVSMPSGCNERVCSNICFGSRRAGSARVHGIHCLGFVPDVEDCPPM